MGPSEILDRGMKWLMNAGMCGVGYNVYVFFWARFHNNYAFFLKLLDDTPMIAKCWSLLYSVERDLHDSLTDQQGCGFKGRFVIKVIQPLSYLWTAGKCVLHNFCLSSSYE